jgi:hypothetical protein
MPPEHRDPRILYVASGSPVLALPVLRQIEGRFADHRVDLVVSEALLEQLTPEQRARVVFVVGRSTSRLRFLWTARLEPSWMSSLLVAAQPGYFTMKLAGLLLGVGRVIVCYNERGEAFALDRHHFRVIVAHITNRLGARQGLVVQRPLLWGLYAMFGEPIGLSWMLLSIGLGRIHGLLRGRSVRSRLTRLGNASSDLVGVLKDAVDHGDPMRAEDATGTSVPA